MYEIECPYCHKEADYDGYDSDELTETGIGKDIQCQLGGEEFIITVEYIPMYTAEKITE